MEGENAWGHLLWPAATPDNKLSGPPQRVHFI
jgi:hypothetical protein